MVNSRINDHVETGWVLSAVAVAVAVLMTEGLFALVDCLIGITLLLVLRAGSVQPSASSRLKWAYSTLSATCWLLVLGIGLDTVLAFLGRIDSGTNIGSGKVTLPIYLRDVLLFVLWGIISLFYRYVLMRGTKPSVAAQDAAPRPVSHKAVVEGPYNPISRADG
jgi:hypothetical protein